jgi:hypothetical protein
MKAAREMKTMTKLSESLGILAICFEIIFASSLSLANRIDSETVWYGVEYTYQDQEMVNETGRNTMTTPHKAAKVKEFANALARELGLPLTSITEKTTWKPGLFLNVPNDGQWVLNTEPVTIEINTTPRTLPQLKATAEPIFRAASSVGLVAYVNPAAERSGMGHMHIGARNLAENPFFANPLLLRNVMVYLHKNPSLLHGFAEAYDIGMNSNIETYHEESRQREFQKAVSEFDAWYEGATKDERKDGFNVFLKFLQTNGKTTDFFTHYRYINLEHVKRGLTQPFKPTDAGKFTIEFRNFRPPKDASTTEAFAQLLAAVMEKQSVPNYKEVFRWISKPEYERFNSGTKVLENWSVVRKELKLSDERLDGAVAEYASAVQRYTYKIAALPEAEVFNAFSEKGKKGRVFEIRMPFDEQPLSPLLTVGESVVEFEKVKIGRKVYWDAVVDTNDVGISSDDLLQSRAKMQMIKGAEAICRRLF